MEQCCQSRCFQFKYVVEDFRIGKCQVKMGNENSFTPFFGKQLIFSNGIMRIACELSRIPILGFEFLVVINSKYSKLQWRGEGSLSVTCEGLGHVFLFLAKMGN